MLLPLHGPILQPYVVLAGLAEGLISDAQVREFQRRDDDEGLTPGEFEATPPPSLF
jgi:hypothetical protein